MVKVQIIEPFQEQIALVGVKIDKSPVILRTGLEPGYHCLLKRMRRSDGQKIMHLLYAFGDLRRSDHVSYSPSRDRIGLGKGGTRYCALTHSRQ